MLVYTIKIERFTSSWAWMKDANDETMYLGNHAGCIYGWYGEHRISAELMQDFNAWVKRMVYSGVNQENFGTQFNWQDFNLYGIDLAKRLKTELGEQANVRYINATEDPDYNREEGFEILSDRTVIPIKRLYWTPI